MCLPSIGKAARRCTSGNNLPWLKLLPGFTWLTWPSFLLGLVETFLYGIYVGLVFAPLYNFFVSTFSPR
jgi:hypothetical protein